MEARRAELAPSGVGITFLRQDPLDGTAHALLLARGFAREEPFILGWGDILVEPRTYRALAAAARDGSEVLAVNEVDDPHAGAAVYASDDGRVTRIVEKPARGTSDTRWNNAGLCVLGPGAWPFVDAVVPSPRGEYELASAIEAYVASGAVVRAMPVLGSWFDVGTPEDLARARAAFGA
ncbi:MAG: sugar phosphate nucleotidyltransferase [Acidobacteriota bacterium]